MGWVSVCVGAGGRCWLSMGKLQAVRQGRGGMRALSGTIWLRARLSASCPANHAPHAKPSARVQPPQRRPAGRSLVSVADEALWPLPRGVVVLLNLVCPAILLCKQKETGEGGDASEGKGRPVESAAVLPGPWLGQPFFSATPTTPALAARLDEPGRRSRAGDGVLFPGTVARLGATVSSTHRQPSDATPQH